MNRDYLKSSPGFFRLIKLSMALMILLVLALALLVPAPLQEPANLARVPNPVKSAWFLLWIQELVSYSKYLINVVALLALACALLPWLTRRPGSEKAQWLGRDNLTVSLLALAFFGGICALTVAAMFFRGENWAFALPF